MADRSALFVRLTPEQAGRLDRAAAAVPAHKKDLIGALVERYVDPESSESMATLRELAGPPTRPVRLPAPGKLVLGHHEFRPATVEPISEVLDAAQVAELLVVEPAAVLELAEQGELPGRRIGGEWRFSRSAVLAWLGAPPR